MTKMGVQRLPKCLENLALELQKEENVEFLLV
jgi:hypothetical protein